jgi:putative CocE/NonD family hydrolase
VSGTANTVECSPTRSDAKWLWLLLALFCLRVLGQILVALFSVSFLPPMEEWFSGVISYPPLLVSQFLIILLFGKICLDYTRGRGYFTQPRPVLGTWLTVIGSTYLAVMIIRYVMRMSLYPHERWTGGSIPIFFHWVLATFILVFARHHKRHPIRHKLAISAPIAIGVLAWMGVQLAPWLLGRSLGLRPSEFAVRAEHVKMKTSDGIALGTDIYHPVRAGKTPTILVRLPLPKNLTYRLFMAVIGGMWAERGYTAVIQSTRGRYGSDGRYYPLSGERKDGVETLQWLARQPWFDGRLGMWGGSAFGQTEWVLADQSSPGPAAMLIWQASADFHSMFYPGGAFALESAVVWALRTRGPYDDVPSSKTLDNVFRDWPPRDAGVRNTLESIGYFEDWRKHREHDAYWSEIDAGISPSVSKPALLLMAGWFDPFLPSQLQDFERAPNAHVIIGPWVHAGSAILPDGVTTRNFRLETLAPSVGWFDGILHPSGAVPSRLPIVRLYVMGKNVWRDEERWPIARAVNTSYFLAADGGLATVKLARIDTPISYHYDPHTPVPSAGGAVLGARSGVMKQNAIEERKDVRVYTTAPVENDTEVTGPVRLILYVATTAKNSDFTAKLVDVYPDGSAYNVCDGILRRDYSPGVNKIEIALAPTSMVFLKGHRIRLEVSSSNYPHYDPNPNKAEQTIHHGIDTPSQLILPMVPGQ